MRGHSVRKRRLPVTGCSAATAAPSEAASARNEAKEDERLLQEKRLPTTFSAFGGSSPSAEQSTPCGTVACRPLMAATEFELAVEEAKSVKQNCFVHRKERRYWASSADELPVIRAEEPPAGGLQTGILGSGGYGRNQVTYPELLRDRLLRLVVLGLEVGPLGHESPWSRSRPPSPVPPAARSIRSAICHG
ncbi:hypothetical protein AK812_SmicGene36899 [Symbiodinium microadriaticum]|uniref:Uncharacterized protein n=1 Tax=Symbiodinium microadriaticum TaxID=2951 RepID=A0A1Q9CHX0_SYMMI|nr:hypothetical protein AK812_SmicGene36899 [Symbiodinium microadriaticum]